MNPFLDVNLESFTGLIWLIVRLDVLLVAALIIILVARGGERPMLVGKYLRRKLMPLCAAAGVTLCTAMVIIVISVMGGFLEMVRGTAQKLTGQITVDSDITGFEHYDQLVERLVALPEVDAAAPMIHSWGLIKLASVINPVEVVGADARAFDGVTGFASTLHWASEDILKFYEERGITGEVVDYYKRVELRDLAMDYHPPANVDPAIPGIITGIEVSPYAMRDETGEYNFAFSVLGEEVTLTVLPVSEGGSMAAFGPQRIRMAVANEFKSGLYDVDSRRVYVGFDVLQKLLKMEHREEEGIDPETGDPTGEMIVSPARATQIMLRGVPDIDLDVLAEAVRKETLKFGDDTNQPLLQVVTWEQRHATLLGAVEKEKALLTVLFAIISLVAVVLVAVIFYMIVTSKTRDIGTLRALGASRRGVAGVFMGYGLAIGVVGAGLGFLLAYSVVSNINELQTWLDNQFNLVIWDPRIYYFERIPDRIDPFEVACVIVAAVCSSLLGSVIPALRASSVDPVVALRYE